MYKKGFIIEIQTKRYIETKMRANNIDNSTDRHDKRIRIMKSTKVQTLGVMAAVYIHALEMHR
jgi:hypothetical protein